VSLPFQSKFEADFTAPFMTRFVNIFIYEHFPFVNIFVYGRFHLVNAFVLWTFSFCEHFRFASIFVLWVRNSLGYVSTKMKTKYPHILIMHQTLPKLGTTKIPKLGETETSDSFWVSDHASVNPTRFGFGQFYHVTFCLFDINLLIFV